MRKFNIDKRNKAVEFEFDYDHVLREKIKNLDRNCSYNPELKKWKVPVNKYTKNAIVSIIKTFGFIRKQVNETPAFIHETMDFDYDYIKQLCDEQDFLFNPRDYQLEALAYALEKGNIINGDDVGLGKTFESIIYAEVTNSFPCVVITPASVKEQWKEQWTKITKGKRTVSTITTKPTKKNPNNWDADVVVINYDILGKKQGTGTAVKFQELLNNDWKMAIYDEAHFLKDKKAQRSQASKKICKKKGLKVQLLTGTAIMSRPEEIWNLLQLINKDSSIASNWKKFIYRFCDAFKTTYGMNTKGASNTLELNRLLRENCYIRREKRQVLKELPPVTKQVIQVPITNARIIKKAVDDFIGYMVEYKGEEAADKALEAQHLVALGELRRLAIAGKAKGIVQYLKDWRDAGNGKLLVFGIHKELLEELSELFGCPLIAGGVSSKNKHKIVQEWIKNDDLFLFANTESAGTGVDGLQHVCSNMLILELPWRPSDIIQMIGRLERSGQLNATNVTFLLNFNTIDREMWQMLQNKEKVTEAVNKGVDVEEKRVGLSFIVEKAFKEFA